MEWKKEALRDFSRANLTSAVFVLYSALLKVFPEGNRSAQSVVNCEKCRIKYSDERALREMCSVGQLMLNRFLSVLQSRKMCVFCQSFSPFRIPKLLLMKKANKI